MDYALRMTRQEAWPAFLLRKPSTATRQKTDLPSFREACIEKLARQRLGEGPALLKVQAFLAPLRAVPRSAATGYCTASMLLTQRVGNSSAGEDHSFNPVAHCGGCAISRRRLRDDRGKKRIIKRCAPQRLF